jgi:hypothetical protein
LKEELFRDFIAAVAVEVAMVIVIDGKLVYASSKLNSADFEFGPLQCDCVRSATAGEIIRGKKTSEAKTI